jgi:hypothetical protein
MISEGRESLLNIYDENMCTTMMRVDGRKGKNQNAFHFKTLLAFGLIEM